MKVEHFMSHAAAYNVFTLEPVETLSTGKPSPRSEVSNLSKFWISRGTKTRSASRRPVMTFSRMG